MINITIWSLFVIMSVWNAVALSVILEYITAQRKFYYNDYIVIFVCFAIWFACGVYLFGL